MITKIKTIKNLAIFKDFNWDDEVVDSKNKICDFKKINIIYGRNYSGKTTISRIFRAMETGSISDKYENPQCCVCLENDEATTQNDFTDHNKTIRVFNDDFIRQHLKFITNQDDNIQPFAILGEGNNNIEEDIKSLKNELGSDKKDEETGLYKELKQQQTNCDNCNNNYYEAKKELAKKLKYIATNKDNGIKYNSDKFGDQNYNITKLQKDISIVIESDFEPITDDEKTKYEDIIAEETKPQINKLEISLNFKKEEIQKTANELITREISRSDKIEELVKNAILNRWVKEGRDLHKDKLTLCAFCNSEIIDERWNILDRHFDEQSAKLENDIEKLLEKVKQEKTRAEQISTFNKDSFYSNFHDTVEDLSKRYIYIVQKYKESLQSIENQLNERKDDILNKKSFKEPQDYSKEIENIRKDFEQLRTESNTYTKDITSLKRKAKKKLRLREVYDRLMDIDYTGLKNKINILYNTKKEAEDAKEEVGKNIKCIRDKIDEKQKTIQDEGKGADKVNEYLNNFFGYNFLTLEAIVESEDINTGDKKYRFEIQRNSKKAYHLSQGEFNLIAFCYFMAKLQDIDTKSKKPIIWIDDPISSLDSHHIFFIYTLISTKIVAKDDFFEQLFISTHNLEFLRLLKQLNIKNKSYLIIERDHENATIKIMPKFLREYVTEFNYLFEQIYKCSELEKVDERNYTAFYNFGNNARKFLEIFLYYKYPDSTVQHEKMKNFFDNEDIPTFLTKRITNEYSHLIANFERGSDPILVSEMNKVARLIIKKIEEKDNDQYTSLLRSIGKSENSN